MKLRWFTARGAGDTAPTTRPRIHISATAAGGSAGVP
jgi:hypothetical protein